jgi:hypothetical protein
MLLGKTRQSLTMPGLLLLSLSTIGVDYGLNFLKIGVTTGSDRPLKYRFHRRY